MLGSTYLTWIERAARFVGLRLKELWHGPSEVAEFMSGTIALWWAGLLASPGFSFDMAFSYSALGAWGTEWSWSVICGVTGILQLGALVLNWRPLRRFASGIAAALWISVTGAILVANPWSTGVGNYLIIALSTMWASLRKETRHADARGA